MPVPVPRRQPVEYDTVKMVGGWDQLTPKLSLSPGALLDVTNFEIAWNSGGGYSRIGGYERYDGRSRPSDASYTVVQVSRFTNTPTVGQTLTGFTSAATGVIVALGSNFLVLTKLSGTFTNTEVVKVGATTIGTVVPTATVFTSIQDAQYTQAAADIYRADIGAVPGSGPVRGVVGLVVSGTDKVYAFRDNAGGTAVDIYVASASGWTSVPLFYEISFTAGAVATPADGAILTQGGVTATVKRVCLQSGAWTGAGAGRLIITAPSGGNFAAGAATLTGGATCTLAGIQTAITISPGGRFQFAIGNLAGQTESVRAYGIDSVNRGFEFDGTTYVPITTGTSTDVPTAVAIFQKQVFFAFRSSVIHSGPGTPFIWTAGGGASEIACGNTVTNFVPQPGGTSTAALGITTTDNYYTLYGSGVANWSLVGLNAGIGGIPRTAQLLNQGYWLDDAGVINLRTSQAYGNFTTSSLTQHINTFMTNQRSLVADSVICHNKSQYRLYFTDGQGLYLTIANGKFLGATKVSFPTPVIARGQPNARTIPNDCSSDPRPAGMSTNSIGVRRLMAQRSKPHSSSIGILLDRRELSNAIGGSVWNCKETFTPRSVSDIVWGTIQVGGCNRCNRRSRRVSPGFLAGIPSCGTRLPGTGQPSLRRRSNCAAVPKTFNQRSVAGRTISNRSP